MNHFRLTIIGALLAVFVLPNIATAATSVSLTKQLSGRILLQVESYGRAWYVYPKDAARYYMKNGEAAYQIMRELGLGITDADLAKIPTKKGQKTDSNLIDRLRGYILLQVEQSGEAWYVNPVDGLRYYLRNGDDAYNLMRSFGLGISNNDLRSVAMNTEQVSPTYTFSDVAYVAYDGSKKVRQQYADNILPLASVTKLMTAMVLLDHGFDFDGYVTITTDQIAYPKRYVGDAMTSEVDLQIGDVVSLNDLWVAMLSASSNQATVALVDTTGMTHQEFVAAMNQKAKELGLTKTVFYDVAGLDAHNASTPSETALFGGIALGDDRIGRATRLTEHVYAAHGPTASREVKIQNRNFSLLAFDPDGAKTGYLVEAEKNVVFKKGDIVITILHARTLKERNEIIDRILKELE
jgi:D-alanyl-D-alanine endopeptidase (penicillin-binding protein 7)